MKHILIINNGLAGGGIERASVSLANFFYSKGIQVSVLALYKSEKFFDLDNDISFYEPQFSRHKMSKYWYLIKMIFYLRQSVKKINPDTILAFGEWTNPYVVLGLSGLKYPLFVSDRMGPMAKLPLISEYIRRNYYKKTTGIIAQSNFGKEVLEKKTKALNIHVIYNPVNCVEKVKCLIKNRIVSVGRLEEVKGHEFLIKAFAKLENKDWELSIVGDGSLMKKLKSLVNSLGIEDRVFFHGHLKDFRLQLSEAKIFVLPSLSEGFPNALIEAMSVPLACIATDTFNGHNEIIENERNGLLVQPGNIDQLTFSISQLINNTEFRELLMSNAFKVRDDLNFETIAQKYLDIILNKE